MGTHRKGSKRREERAVGSWRPVTATVRARVAAPIPHSHAHTHPRLRSSTIPERTPPRADLLPLATEKLAARSGLTRHYIRCAFRGEFVPHMGKLLKLGRALAALHPGRLAAHAPVHSLAFELGLVSTRPPRAGRGLTARDLQKEGMALKLSHKSGLGYPLVWAILARRQPPTPLTAGLLAAALGTTLDELARALGLR